VPSASAHNRRFFSVQLVTPFWRQYHHCRAGQDAETSPIPAFEAHTPVKLVAAACARPCGRRGSGAVAAVRPGKYLGGHRVVHHHHILAVLLFFAATPKRYEVLPDSLRIVLGGPFSINIPFSTIAEVRVVQGWRAYSKRALHLAISRTNAVEIIRTEGWNLIVSPTDRDVFIESVFRAMGEFNGNIQRQGDVLPLDDMAAEHGHQDCPRP